MSPLKDQAEDGKARELHWKALLWLAPPPACDGRRRLGPGDLADFRFGRLSSPPR
jgi:hypothetical protein